MIDLINNTPPVYTEQSRDFQLFLHLYESSFNQIKNDIDLQKYIIDTKNCKTELLPLLASKLGFLTNYSLNMDMLRSVVEGFPDLLRNKGSLTSITQTINLFLQTLNIKTDILIFYADTGSIAMKEGISDHTLLVGINEAVSNFQVLYEIMRYILPAGFGFSFFFFRSYNRTSWLRDLHKVNLIYAGEEYTDSIRYPMFDVTRHYEVGDMVTYVSQVDSDPEYFLTSPNSDFFIVLPDNAKFMVAKNQHTYHLGQVYRCIEETTGPWDPSCWELDIVASRLLNAIDTLQVYNDDAADEIPNGTIIRYNEDGYELDINQEEEE